MCSWCIAFGHVRLSAWQDARDRLSRHRWPSGRTVEQREHQPVKLTRGIGSNGCDRCAPHERGSIDANTGSYKLARTDWLRSQQPATAARLPPVSSCPAPGNTGLCTGLVHDHHANTGKRLDRGENSKRRSQILSFSTLF